MNKIKPTIRIMRNCQNGEHVFIPALTHKINLGADEHDVYVSAFVCQHCLYYVSDEVWAAHLHNSYMTNEPEHEAKLINQLDSIKNKIEEVKKEPAIEIKKQASKQSYPGKRRGPKPKQMDIPGTGSK